MNWFYIGTIVLITIISMGTFYNVHLAMKAQALWLQTHSQHLQAHDTHLTRITNRLRIQEDNTDTLFQLVTGVQTCIIWSDGGSTKETPKKD